MNSEEFLKNNKQKLAILLCIVLIAAVLMILKEARVYPFTIPKAVFTIETGKSQLVPLTTDASKMVVRP